MKYDLDLTHCHAQRTFGDITAFMTWFGKRNMPALVLLPTRMIGREGAIPCVIPVSSAWAWAEETGDGAHCARASVEFARLLYGCAPSIAEVTRVMSIVRECMHDLLTIPPKPATDRVVVADAVRTDANGKQIHSEIMDDAT